MKNFEYAAPRTEAEALEFLNSHDGNTAVLAGGTDLVGLMREHLLEPDRVVDVNRIDTMKGVQPVPDGVVIGALTTLDEAFEHRLLADYHSVRHIVDATHSIQIQSMGTIGGDLCHLPNCWYFRSGYGLLGMEQGESLPALGDNRYHAILANQGPAKFVSASRFAPALVAWEARVRIIGPEPTREEWLPLEYFYITPKLPNQGVTVLRPGQLLTHIWLPTVRNTHSASYEVLETEGLDWPLAAAAACLELQAGHVRRARIVMGHVAPIPWVAYEAGDAIAGRSLDEETAALAGELAVANATPLAHNEYKVQLAKTAVKRALLRAADMLEGGL